MEKVLNFTKVGAKAKRMSQAELEYALKDCVECVWQEIDEGYYSDEASVYRDELIRRGVRPIH